MDPTLLSIKFSTMEDLAAASPLLSLRSPKLPLFRLVGSESPGWKVNIESLGSLEFGIFRLVLSFWGFFSSPFSLSR